MRQIKNMPPKLALLLLNYLLPASVRDEIAGDLSEEFYHSRRPLIIKQLVFWHQALTTSWSINMNRQRILSMGLALISLFVFGTMIAAVTYLANGDGEVFNQNYWTSGDLYLFFLEPIFWQSIKVELFSDITLNLFINYPSILWAIASMLAITWLDRKCQFNVTRYAVIALICITTPYLMGTVYFKLVDVPLKESGPIIAFMWITIVFLVLPMSLGLIRKLMGQTKSMAA